MKEYTPYWPENLLIVGAGATRELGIEPTNLLGEALLKLAKDDSKSLSVKVKEAFPNIEVNEQEAIVKLFSLLEGKDISGYNFERVRRLREIYDWGSFKKDIQALSKK